MVKLLGKFAAASLCAALSALPLQAQDKTVLTHFSEPVVEKALKALGATDIKHTVSDGQRFTSYRMNSAGADPLNYILAYRVCDAAKKGCLGLLNSIMFNPIEGKPYGIQQVNTFNQSRIFTSAMLMKGGMLALVRYQISDGGITHANLQKNLEIFTQMPAQLADHFRNDRAIEANAIPAGEAALHTVSALSEHAAALDLAAGLSAGNQLQAIPQEPASKTAQ
ncbi:MAG TPA: hypothetical protein DCL54_17265 [Alphaproteobacteria bacterium]|nr:hypothetical protein [Alphaproteobacteria bacterium]HAJ48327.1 hypothetical protein [Alphaproteobacteria bacterium]